MTNLQLTRTQIEATYRQRTPKSAAQFAQAQRALPGGDTRTSTFFTPYPTYIERGEGARLHDVDGNVLLDFLNNYTSLIHGNAFPPIVEAAQRQMARGSAWAAPTGNQVRLASLICERVPSVEQLRFTNSGTEATMQAIRAARAFSGRDVIVMIEGGYHGTHDSVSSGVGIPRGTREATLSIPFNDAQALAAIVNERNDVAAVIVEPLMGSIGMIVAEHDYLQQLRAITAAHDVLLIMDEVQTFRLDTGGAQHLFNVQPDLTTFAKIIGGGFPVGAFGGRADIMAQFDPRGGKIAHGGTFNGNAVTMAAGLAAMENLTPERIEHANALGDALRDDLRDVLAEQRVRGEVSGLGSLVGVHLTTQPLRSARDAATMPNELRNLLHLALINRGVFTSRSNMMNTSTVMSDADVNNAIQAFQDALLELRPMIESEFPELIG